MHILHLDSVDSTNLYCERLDPSQVEAFTVVWADQQTAGIGQRGNRWHSTVGQSLTFSLMLKPTFLPPDRQFVLTQVLSLALCDLLQSLGIPSADIRIKWPNDIYIGFRKVCGMLITNRLQGGNIVLSVCGIGLNVNQTLFPSDLPNPTSLRMATGNTYDLEPLLHSLLHYIEQYYTAANQGTDLTPLYHERLLGMDEEADYLYLGHPLRATIVGTDTVGHLLLRASDGRNLVCSLKEISFLFRSQLR